MNILDIILLVCFVPGIIAGIRRGFIAQLMGLVSLILGILLAFNFSNALTAWLQDYINVSDNILNVIAFIAILVVVTLVLGLVSKALESVIKIIMLGWLNRLLGALFSFITTFISIGIVILFIHYLAGTFDLAAPAVFQDSVIYNWMKEATLNIFPQLKELFLN